MKKLLLVLVLLAALMTGVAAAEGMTLTSGDYVYNLLEDGTAEIVEYKGRAKALTVPEEIDGHRVTTIATGAFGYSKTLTSITLPVSITAVRGNPFIASWELAEIIVSPDHPVLAVIDGVLFDMPQKRLISYLCGSRADCYTVPEWVLAIGDSAFFGGETLRHITLPEGLVSIGSSAFYDCTRLTEITLPEGVTFIGASAFSRCEALKSITLPQGVTVIRDFTFYYCIDLASVTLPEGLEVIGMDAFWSCRSLAEITLPDGLVSIGPNAFAGCIALSQVSLPDSLVSLDEHAFSSCGSLQRIALPDSLAAVGANPFLNCTQLTEIIVSPDHPTLMTIDGVLFNRVEGRLLTYPCAFAAERYEVPQGTRAIGDSAFWLCRTLGSVTLPEGLESIGKQAFRECSSLSSVTLPEGIVSIGDGAFARCVALKQINLPESVTILGGKIFEKCGSVTIAVSPDSLAHKWCTAYALNFVLQGQTGE